ncbi:hypothetical protein [Blastopirellula marina]|uniref:hypothetical protein n=1 Tax=Blastopirellula marina TaxID=124 RepID=UPI0003258613|nr:hypothetical protein [Blastopirellula marina]
MNRSDESFEPPRVYRAMIFDSQDSLPVVGSTAKELGVRIGVDIHVDAGGNVNLDENGMSVAPRWQDLPRYRIPKRLRAVVPGASGSNSVACFVMGNGAFADGIVASGLKLIPDRKPQPITHGVVAPISAVSLTQYQADLASTRSSWQIDET